VTLTYATRYERDARNRLVPLPAEPVQLGDTVRQNAYGRGLGRLEDCGRLGTVTAVNRTKVVVDFGAQFGQRPVSPDVLRLEARALTVQPRQLPGMARLMELTPELAAHYGD
jgi:hypothetical protein